MKVKRASSSQFVEMSTHVDRLCDMMARELVAQANQSYVRLGWDGHYVILSNDGTPFEEEPLEEDEGDIWYSLGGAWKCMPHSGWISGLENFYYLTDFEFRPGLDLEVGDGSK